MLDIISPAEGRRRIAVVVAVATICGTVTAADATAYFPKGTMLVASINVPRFLESPLVRDNQSLRPLLADATKAFERVGVDIPRNLKRIELAVGESLRAADSLILLQGRFDTDKVSARMSDRAKDPQGGVQILDEGGAAVFQCRVPTGGQNPRVTLPDRFYLTVLDAGTIAIAIDRAAVRNAIAKKAGRAKADVSPRLTEFLGRVDPRTTLAVVFVPPADLLVGGPASGLTALTGGISATDSLSTDVRLDAKDAESARLLAGSVRDGLAKVRDILPGLAALQLGLDRKGQDGIREMVESFKVNVRQSSVVITSIISKEMIEKVSSK